MLKTAFYLCKLVNMCCDTTYFYFHMYLRGSVDKYCFYKFSYRWERFVGPKLSIGHERPTSFTMHAR